MKFKKYIEPEICILLFDEYEDVLTASGDTPVADDNITADEEMAGYMGDNGVSSAVSISINEIQVTGE